MYECEYEYDDFIIFHKPALPRTPTFFCHSKYNSLSTSKTSNSYHCCVGVSVGVSVGVRERERERLDSSLILSHPSLQSQIHTCNIQMVKKRFIPFRSLYYCLPARNFLEDRTRYKFQLLTPNLQFPTYGLPW